MKARPPFLELRRKYEVDESYWLVRLWYSFSRQARSNLRMAALTLKWGRAPNAWELSFIDRMKALQKAGLTFDEILRSSLPQIFGEDTSEVLRSWIGNKARNNPERFARTIAKMFGASARSVVVSVDRLTDEARLFETKTPREPPYKSMLEAIQRADEGMTVAQPRRPQGRL